MKLKDISIEKIRKMLDKLDIAWRLKISFKEQKEVELNAWKLDHRKKTLDIEEEDLKWQKDKMEKEIELKKKKLSNQTKSIEIDEMLLLLR